METSTYFCNKSKQMKKIVFGIILVIAGLLLMGFNTGILPYEYKHIIFSWPMILIAIGLMNLFSRDSLSSGIILLLIGTFFILPHLFFLPDNFHQNFWPVILIIIGLVMIAKRTIFKTKFNARFKNVETDEMKNDNGYIVINNIFGGGKHKAPHSEFRGGKISNVFGGTELDLTQAVLAQGTNVLEVDCIFGGVDIKVPSDWAVSVKVSSIMGGFSDKRVHIKNSSSNSELIIKGSAIFGGGEVKSY